jgi:hypothetical protein
MSVFCQVSGIESREDGFGLFLVYNCVSFRFLTNEVESVAQNGTTSYTQNVVKTLPRFPTKFF